LIDLPRFLQVGRRKVDTTRSLQDLDGQNWGAPQYGTYLEVECPRLRRIQLRKLSLGEIATLIQQDIVSEYLVPIALLHLERNPWLEEAYYPGDLLLELLRLPDDFWEEHPARERELVSLAKRARDQVRETPSLRGASGFMGVDEELDRFLAKRADERA
jgi:hypothetical protein